MFVGYSIKHQGNTYRMWDPTTSQIHTSRDMKWLNRMYFTNKRFFNNDNTANSEAGKSDHNTDVDLNDENDDQSVNSQTSTSSTTSNTSNTSTKSSKSIEPDDIKSIHEDNNDAASTDEPKEHGEHGESDKGEWKLVTRSGRKSYAPKHLHYQTPNEATNSAFTVSESNYYRILSDMNDFDNDEVAMTAGADITNEIATIGAGVGGGFKDTHELHVMKYKEAMKTKDKEKWTQAVQEELERFKKHDVFDVVKLKDVPTGVKMLTTTWAMKLKSNGYTEPGST